MLEITIVNSGWGARERGVGGAIPRERVLRAFDVKKLQVPGSEYILDMGSMPPPGFPEATLQLLHGALPRTRPMTWGSQILK